MADNDLFIAILAQIKQQKCQIKSGKVKSNNVLTKAKYINKLMTVCYTTNSIV